MALSQPVDRPDSRIRKKYGGYQYNRRNARKDRIPHAHEVRVNVEFLVSEAFHAAKAQAYNQEKL